VTAGLHLVSMSIIRIIDGAQVPRLYFEYEKTLRPVVGKPRAQWLIRVAHEDELRTKMPCAMTGLKGDKRECASKEPSEYPR